MPGQKGQPDPEPRDGLRPLPCLKGEYTRWTPASMWEWTRDVGKTGGGEGEGPVFDNRAAQPWQLTLGPVASLCALSWALPGRGQHHPLAARRTSPLTCDTKMSPDIAKCPRGLVAPIENHGSRWAQAGLVKWGFQRAGQGRAQWGCAGQRGGGEGAGGAACSWRAWGLTLGGSGVWEETVPAATRGQPAGGRGQMEAPG